MKLGSSGRRIRSIGVLPIQSNHSRSLHGSLLRLLKVFTEVMAPEIAMDPAIEKGYVEIQDSVKDLTSDEAWTAGGEQRVYVQ